jgi:DNA-binding CsgD family transcriptional regulator
VQLGDVEGALEYARESVELSSRRTPGLISALGEVWLGMALLEAGQPARAVEHLLRAGGEELSEVPGGWRAVYHEALSRARIESGDLDGARRSAEHARTWAERVGLPLAAAMGARATARLALVDGDLAAAAESASWSVASAESAGARVEAARGRVLLGRALGELGDRPGAIAELTRAAEDLGRFGARRSFEAAEQELRRVGGKVSHRSRPRPRGDGFAALSEREREIALLTMDRLTNREIAGRLFLSEKTIESHMRNVFHKLGVTSRADVAAAAERAVQTPR